MNATPDYPSSDPHPGVAARAGEAAKVWLRRIIGAIIVIAVLVGVYFALAAFIPRWWADQVGSMVNKSFSKGVGIGLLFGIVCTAVPLLLLISAARRILSNTAIAVVTAIVAVVVAIPNLMTLGIVLGNGNASHAGERILDVDAPMFRGATLVGAIIGVVIALALTVGLVSFRRKRAEKKSRKAAEKAAARAEKDAAKAQKEAEKAARRGESHAPDAGLPPRDDHLQ